MNAAPTPTWSEVMMNNYGTPAVKLVSGKGAWVQDAQGKQYLDLLAGIAVNALGHQHPAVINALETQAHTLGHISNIFSTPVVLEVAAKLQQCVGSHLEEAKAQAVAQDTRVFFCNSGTEANEAALKITRLTGKTRVLAAHHGFHGRTMGALSLTGQPAKRDIFAPIVPNVEFYPYGDIAFLRELVKQNPANTAAIFLEPIQGETGVIPAPAGFLTQVRELCDEYEILMVVDEVQTGVARTGTFYAYQSEQIVPDIITMAKGLGAGMPIGATLATGKAASLLTPGSHGTTFGGNPYACAVARAVLETIDDAFIAEVASKGAAFAEQLGAIAGVSEVRGRGLMVGVVLEHPIAHDVVRIGLEHGLILNAPSVNVIRLTPPLIISAEELTQAASSLAEVIAQCASATAR
ncbi:MAG: acetylornithine transaminase [Corynebacterium sp.]|nr:acetylornithine transaminase [Corynebacterium sp.]